MNIECTGCMTGIKMCYNRPCLGTPEDFIKILDAGFAFKLQMDYWIGEKDENGSKEPNIFFLTGGVHKKKYDNDLSLLDLILGTQSEIDIDDEYSEEHSGGKKAPYDPVGKCTLLTDDNKCSLHSVNLKPEQGRESCCKAEYKDNSKHNYHYAKLWDTDLGRSVVERWKQLVNYNTLD